MPQEEKHKINVWIPGSLWKQVEALGYDSPTKATIAAFEALILQEDTGSNQEDLGSVQEALGSSQDEFRKLQEAIRKHQEIIIPNLERQVKDLEARPDPVAFAQLQARYEAIQIILDEKDKRIESLEDDLKKADRDKEDLKQMHNNYFLQVQTLINQKAIGSPAQGKSQHAQKESNLSSQDGSDTATSQDGRSSVTSKESSVPAQEKKHIVETVCLTCGELFTAERSTRKFCSGKCKAAYYRKKSKEEII